MIEIKINLTADSIGEFLDTVRKFQTSLTDVEKPVKKATKEVGVKEITKETATNKATEDKQTSLTLEYVRSKVAEKANEGKKVEIRQLLTDFEVAKVTELPAERYAEFLQKLSEI